MSAEGVYYEEEYYEDYQPVALAPIDDEDNDDNDDSSSVAPNSLPTSASQYLRSVMREAKLFPDVAIASNRHNSSSHVAPKSAPLHTLSKKQLGPTMRLFSHVMNSPDYETNDANQSNFANVNKNDERLPSSQWQVDQLEQFIMLHHYMQILKVRIKENNERGPNIPSADNEFIWCCELYGKDFACKVVDIDTIPKTLRKRPWYLKLKEELKETARSPKSPSTSALSSSATRIETNLNEDETEPSVNDSESEEDEDDDDGQSNASDNMDTCILNERTEQILESTEPIRKPILSFMAFLPQKAIECLLQWHLEWFSSTLPTNVGEHVHAQEQSAECGGSGSGDDDIFDCVLNNSSCLWVYSLLSVLEKPVRTDTVYTLRQLCRLCKKIRSNIIISEHDVKQLAAVNLLILIISRFFDQFDLADP